MTESDLRVRIAPFGPSQEAIDRLSRQVLRHPDVRHQLDRTQHRLLSFDLVDPEHSRGQKYVRPAPAAHYRGTIFDYSNNRTVLVEGRIDRPDEVNVCELAVQPVPSPEEFQAAVQVIQEQSEELAQALRAGLAQPYPAMPPLIAEELPDGRIERTIAVGLLPRSREFRHEIIGVNMIRQSIVHFENGAPPLALAHDQTCGHPYAGQPTERSAAGQVRVTVTQGGTVLWRFLAIRPAASSGTNGSGVELRYVDYRGKRVLYRAHVPILNVRYEADACGPYLDWQNQEGMIDATGADVAPGFRLCPAPAKTILDTGSDVGNFLGVAIYVEGSEVVLVCEMEAGWYRYLSQWRLHADGTIRPRFGFAAVNSSSCACRRHYHHAYWRLDFDIRTASQNRVREFNDPPLLGGASWHTKTYEIRRPRDPARNRKWRIENTSSGEAYDIVPGPQDGVATQSPDWPFPQGDVWILRYRGSEVDNGVIATGPPYEANIDNFRNGELVDDRDVVVWYAGHVTHDEAAEPPGTLGHVVGPDLVPVNW